MDFVVILKGGFMGFALTMGVLILVFYLVGSFVKISPKNFVRVFVLAGSASFLAVYVLLHYKIRVATTPDAAFFLAGCVGGWLAGITSGLTQMKSLLLKLR
jgi:hypothetical protein